MTWKRLLALLALALIISACGCISPYDPDVGPVAEDANDYPALDNSSVVVPAPTVPSYNTGDGYYV